MHLLVESSLWESVSEFVTPEGNIMNAIGETKIIVDENNSYSGPYWATILADTGPPFWSIPGHFIK